MSEPQDDVLHKLDALMKKHAPTEPEIPVLTDLVEQPRIDLDSIPVLTEEIHLDLSPDYHVATPVPEPTPPQELADLSDIPQADQAIDLDLVHVPTLQPEPDEVAASLSEHNSVLARLEEVEHEVEAEIKARMSRVQKEEPAPIAPALASIEIPPHAEYITLTPPEPAPEPVIEAAPPPAPEPAAVIEPVSIPMPVVAQIPEETIREITAQLEADIARMIKNNVHQTLAEDLPGVLNTAMDKAISSMFDQFMVHIEEVVRHTIADELKKQLAPFKRPTAGNKPPANP